VEKIYTFNLEFTTTSSLLFVVINLLMYACFDEICRRSLNFVQACVKHESPLVRLLALYGLNVACNDSFFDRNVLFRADRYCCTVSDILQGSINNIINSHEQFTTVNVQSADCLLTIGIIEH